MCTITAERPTYRGGGGFRSDLLDLQFVEYLGHEAGASPLQPFDVARLRWRKVGW